MDFEKFKNWAVEEVRCRLPEDYDSSELYFEEIRKFGGNYTGLSIRSPGVKIAPTVNMEQFYGYYLDGISTEELGRVMAEMLQYRFNDPSIDLEWIGDYQKASEHFFLCLSNASKRAGYLADAPHWLRADLALTCHVMYELPEEGYVGTVINDPLMEEYGVDKERIFLDAVKNSIRIMPPRVEFARDIYEDDEERDDDDPFYNMVDISNEKHFRGAAVLFYPGVMEEVAMMLGGSYYVLPSSVHEVLAIPADPSVSVTFLRQLVMEANLLHVPDEEQLSDEVYFYDECTGHFGKAEQDAGALN